MGAYLCWLGVRVLEMRRILKPTGSLYLHLDHTAGAWGKAMLDAIFGRRNFRNELVWWYSWGYHTDKYWNRKHDTILYYAKDAKRVVFDGNRVRVPYRTGSNMTTDSGWNKSYNPAGKLPEDVLDIPTINAHVQGTPRLPDAEAASAVRAHYPSVQQQGRYGPRPLLRLCNDVRGGGAAWPELDRHRHCARGRDSHPSKAAERGQASGRRTAVGQAGAGAPSAT